MVELPGHTSDTAGGAVTVNVDAQVDETGGQLLVYVKSTVVEPPQLFGAPVLLFDRLPLHPPLAVADASQLVNALFTAVCV